MENIKKIIRLLELFCHYFGLKFIKRKFFPVDEKELEKKQTNNKKLIGTPTGVLWVLSIYIALFGIASQRYENRVDVIENRANALFAQISVAGTRKFARAGDIQNMPCPEKPDIRSVPSVFRSLFFKDGIYPEIVKHIKNTIIDYKYDLAGYTLVGANLEGANLREAKLNGANLQKGNFEGADFTYAILREAYLEWANLREANFKGAILDRAGFYKADFRKAQLNGAELRGADLQWANFEGADLREANFEGANLRGAKFQRADLQKANFKGADLHGANLSAILNCSAIQLIQASNLYHMKNCPKDIIEGIEAYRCEEMLMKTPDKWSEEFKEHRERFILKILTKGELE